MILKIIGSILVLSSTSIIGICYVDDMQKRLKELNGVKKSILLISGDLEYGGMSISDIFAHIEKYSIKEHREFWYTLSKSTSTKGESRFSEIWVNTLEDKFCNSRLTKEDKNELSKLGNTLSDVDKRQQITMLKLYIEHLELNIQTLKEEKDRKSKIYHSLGVVSGLFLIVILM